MITFLGIFAPSRPRSLRDIAPEPHAQLSLPFAFTGLCTIDRKMTHYILCLPPPFHSEQTFFSISPDFLPGALFPIQAITKYSLLLPPSLNGLNNHVHEEIVSF